MARAIQRFEVAPSDLGIGVLRADDLALLGQPDLPFDGAWRLHQDGLVAWPAPSSDRGATAMEQLSTLPRIHGDLLFVAVQESAPVGWAVWLGCWS